MALVASLASCSQPQQSTAAAQPVLDTPTGNAVAGTILRVISGHDVGELRITQESGPDAGDPPYPACLTGHKPDRRVVNFDLNWAGIGFGEHGPAPKVTVTIAGPGSTPLVAEIPQANPPNTCRTVRAFTLAAEGKGWQLVYGLTLQVRSDAKLAYLWITVDGHTRKIQLTLVCNQGSCLQDNPNPFQGNPHPPVPWSPGTPYSQTLIISSNPSNAR
jgi:hypothetical protein